MKPMAQIKVAMKAKRQAVKGLVADHSPILKNTLFKTPICFEEIVFK